METRRIGFVGLGDMGLGMASNLARKGFQLTACDLRTEPVEAVKRLGAHGAGSPEEAARDSDVVISVVHDAGQTDTVMYGPRGVLGGIGSGATIIVSSTLGPHYLQDLAAAAAKRGVNVLDAAVSGARLASEAGTLTFMVGGDDKVFRSCLPVFQAMGKNIFHLGGVGAGQAFKLVNNVTLIITDHAVSEGIALGLKAGLKLDRMLEVMKASTANSWVVEHYDHMVQRRKQWQREEFDSSSTYKDLDLALAYARELKTFVLPVAALVSQIDKGTTFPEEEPAGK